MKTAALVLFILMYVIMIALPKFRPHAALGTGLIYLILGILPFSQIPLIINWNVLMMISGTMVIVEYFIDSNMPAFLADKILDKASNVMYVTIFMSLFSGIVSAFIDNVATVLIVAPVALAICKTLKISPVSMILSIAVSSNLQGAATLVGDTTSILLGDYAHMDFLDFFWMKGRPGIFFAVELGALSTVIVMYILFRDQTAPVKADRGTKVKNYNPTFMLIAMVVCLIAASFVKDKPDITNGVICLTAALLTAVLDWFQTNDPSRFKKALKAVDTETLLLLTGLFVVIGGITEAGIIDDLASLISALGSGNLFRLYSIVVWGSVIISAFVDNIPYVATMLPVLTGVCASLQIEPYLLYFGLLCGATLGGNLTPIGASANITAVGMLNKEGYQSSFKDFMRIGVPFTLAAVTTAYIFLWLVWR